MADEQRYPLLVDTDALIAVANSPLWDEITERVGITTTNVCEQELKRHVDSNAAHAEEGSRPYRLHHGSRTVLESLDDEEQPLTRVVSVPRPHGADAGEVSLRQEVVQNPEVVDRVVMMDAHGRRSIRRAIQTNELEVRVVPPTYLFYILYDNDIISKETFCRACEVMLDQEGWTGYQAVKAAWEGIPVDCSEFLAESFVP